MPELAAPSLRVPSGRAVVLAMALGLALAGCGSSSEESSGDAGGGGVATTEVRTTTTAVDPGPAADGSCTETVTSTIGQPVQVVIEAGAVDCPTAVALVDTYYNDPPTEPQGSGGFVEVDGWSCSSTSAAEAERTGRYGTCTEGDGRIVMRPAPTPAGAVDGGDLELSAEGIGLATWGAVRSEVVDAVSAVLGEPTDVYENVDETSPDFDFHLQAGRYYTWDGLTLYFERDTDGLTWYQLSAERFDPTTGEFVEQAPTEVATTAGLQLGDDVDEVFASYAPLQVWSCDYETFDRTVTPATEGQDGTLVTALDGYFITVEDGVVTDIGHARGDERDVCY